MPEFLAYELLPRVFNMSVTAGIVIAAVLAARLLLRKSPKVFSYALWSVVLFRLLCPISFTAGFSLLELADTPVRATTSYTTAVEYVQPNLVQTEPAQVQFPVEAVNQAINGALPQGGEQAVTNPLESLVAAAAWIWLLGMLAMALYSVGTYIAIRRRLIGAVLMRGNIYLADHIPSPFVMGIVHPKIYLPSVLRVQEQGYIIRHEQYHIQRLDHIVKALSILALCVHWYNPMVWAAFIFSGKDMEMSCDEAVVSALGEDIRADYSASLLSLATGRRMIAGTPLAFGEGDTKGRIRNLVNWSTPKRWTLLLSAVVCIAVAGACAANPQRSGSGPFADMEDFAQQTMESAKTVIYNTTDGGENTATVTDTKLAWLEKQGEVPDLAPEGTLEAWTFNYLVQVDADPNKISLVGGMSEKDGWYDLEGQGGHNLVVLRYPDGSYDILYDQIVNDNMDFYGYHNSYEEAVYDWYVTKQGLDLPLYVEDWTDQITVPEPGNLGNFPVHRFDGDGWYLYIPVQAWNRVDAPGDSWQSGYNTGSALTVYKQEQDARSQADNLISHGWIEVEDTVPHVRHLEYNLEDFYYDAPDGGSYQVRIEWQTQNITDNPYISIEPAVLSAMAESFTVDERMAVVLSPGEASLMESLGGVEKGDPLTLRLTQGDSEVGVYHDCWPVSNAVYYFSNLKDAPWRAVEEGVLSASDLQGKHLATLSGDSGWSLTAYEGMEEVHFTGPADEWWLVPEMEGLSAYQILRGWFDEIEYAALGGDYGHQNLVIPDGGQSYLEAAAAYVEAFEGIHLQATEGSKFCYSFVSTSVEAAEEMTVSLREQGELGETAYCFYLTTVFTPQNEDALHWSRAGNTGDYTGDDPDVPAGAMEYYRCGYITLEEDGWHGKLVGTGW